MRALLVASLVVAWPGAPRDARGDGRDGDRAPGRELCARGVAHHGAAIDLDVQAAALHDVLRLIADAGHVNLVVTGTVTLRLRRVAWDAAACAASQLHHLTITIDGNILVVTNSGRAR